MHCDSSALLPRGPGLAVHLKADRSARIQPRCIHRQGGWAAGGNSAGPYLKQATSPRCSPRDHARGRADASTVCLADTVIADVAVLQRKTFERLRAQQMQAQGARWLAASHSATARFGRCGSHLWPECRDWRVRPKREHQHLVNAAIGRSSTRRIPASLITLSTTCRARSSWRSIVRRRSPLRRARAPGPLRQRSSTRCDVQFSDFAELQAEVECSASVIDERQDGHVQIAATLHQLDKQIGEGRVELRFLSARRSARSVGWQTSSSAVSE